MADRSNARSIVRRWLRAASSATAKISLIFPARATHLRTMRKLGGWLYTRRRELRQGVLPYKVRARLEVLPGGDGPGGKKTKEDRQPAARLDAVVAYLRAGNDWPRNGTGETEE